MHLDQLSPKSFTSATSHSSVTSWNRAGSNSSLNVDSRSSSVGGPEEDPHRRVAGRWEQAMAQDGDKALLMAMSGDFGRASQSFDPSFSVGFPDNTSSEASAANGSDALILQQPPKVSPSSQPLMSHIDSKDTSTFTETSN